MTDIAIRVENLSKLYRIGQQERYKALHDSLTDALCAPFRALATVVRQPRSAVGQHHLGPQRRLRLPTDSWFIDMPVKQYFRRNW